jgi:hypothetical protein
VVASWDPNFLRLPGDSYALVWKPCFFALKVQLYLRAWCLGGRVTNFTLLCSDYSFNKHHTGDRTQALVYAKQVLYH